MSLGSFSIPLIVRRTKRQTTILFTMGDPCTVLAYSAARPLSHYTCAFDDLSGTKQTAWKLAKDAVSVRLASARTYHFDNTLERGTRRWKKKWNHAVVLAIPIHNVFSLLCSISLCSCLRADLFTMNSDHLAQLSVQLSSCVLGKHHLRYHVEKGTWFMFLKRGCSDKHFNWVTVGE